MARYTGPQHRLCRREGISLCGSPKCPVTRKGAVPPGQHGLRRGRKPSNYALQLREKQKVKRYYGVLEKQFAKYFSWAAKEKAGTGLGLLQLLESRLDHVVFLLGFASTKRLARQMVSHGHILVNGKRVNVPSYNLKSGDVISLGAKATNIPAVVEHMKITKDEQVPQWLERKGGAGVVKDLPVREQITFPIEEQLIVEYYSR
jgi:small subunit ribosomal protein S4